MCLADSQSLCISGWSCYWVILHCDIGHPQSSVHLKLLWGAVHPCTASICSPFPMAVPLLWCLGRTQCRTPLARSPDQGVQMCVGVTSGHFSPIHSKSESFKPGKIHFVQSFSAELCWWSWNLPSLCCPRDTTKGWCRGQSSVPLPGSISVHHPSSSRCSGGGKAKGLACELTWVSSAGQVMEWRNHPHHEGVRGLKRLRKGGSSSRGLFCITGSHTFMLGTPAVSLSVVFAGADLQKLWPNGTIPQTHKNTDIKS